MEPSDDEQLLTVADIAAHIGAHESTVRGWIKTGELRATKFGARLGWRIRRGDYREFLRQRTHAGAVARELLAATRQ
ncbi:MAG TPA: helix-turn-helix domain-containing protein [Thermomicrobiales bacterium]|jgi:excisionase family DNA binding protein|nr:helix-turn-helix domain-containing protein [Thermomicrobiales bacterium]